ncbi:MAG TPA: diaminopimelate epimerase [Fimbriimonas sp.]
MKFWKVQSIGNHFPLVHLDEAPGDALPRLAIDLCRERFSVGGDGLLAVGMEDEALRLRMFNPDGTEDFCGNGLRCAAMHALRQGWVGSRFTIRHLEREVPAEIFENGRIATRIGQASYVPRDVPHTSGELFDREVWAGMDTGMPLVLYGSALTTGSTHTVIPTMELPDDDSFHKISAKIEVDPKFPQRTSVIWRQEVAPMRLKIRIWERGVGETFGCGTGSSAAAADYLRRRGGGGVVEVENPGGSVLVRMDSWSAPITVEGYAQAVYEGEIPLSSAASASDEPVR